jgi:hypothetical protein
MIKWLIKNKQIMRHQLAVAQNISYADAEKILNLLVMFKLAELQVLVYHKNTDHSEIPILTLKAESFPHKLILDCAECDEQLVLGKDTTFDFLYKIYDKEFEISQVLKLVL